MEEVEKVAQSCDVSLRQHAGEQHGGRGALLLGEELPGLDEGLLQLRGQRRFRQLPEELLHQPSDVAGERGGQAVLASIHFGLDVKTVESRLLKIPEVRLRGRFQAAAHLEGFQTNHRAGLSEQALCVDVCHQAHQRVDQKARREPKSVIRRGNKKEMPTVNWSTSNLPRHAPTFHIITRQALQSYPKNLLLREQIHK